MKKEILTNIAEASEIRGTLNDFNYFSENIDWVQINEVLEAFDWVMEFRNLDPSQKLEKFLNIIQEISEKYVPKRALKAGKTNTAPKERKILMRKRRKIQKQLLRTPNENKTQRLLNALIKIEMELQDSYRKKMMNEHRKCK